MEWYKKSFGEDYLLVYKHRKMDDARVEVSCIEEILDLKETDFILDVCCGAGRHSIALSEKGFRVVGVDLSKYLLAQAKKNASHLTIPFIIADMREFPFLDDCFDVVLNVFTSFGYFSEDDENIKMLFEIKRVLKPAGRFLLDTLNPVRVKENLVPCSQREENGVCITENRWIEDDVVCKKIEVEDDKGKRTYDERVKMYSEYEMREMVDKAGLQLEGVFGGFSKEEFHPNSERMILVGKAEKR